jgi:N-acetylglucosaminyl-diphospho-decaprenol L-rhamnosyltransferase
MIRAVRNHSKLGVFSDIIVIANDLSQEPEELKDIPCTWLVPSRNIGFGSACQLGAMACCADIYAFFNAHITIDRASVNRCIAAFDVQNVGIASPSSYYPRSEGSTVAWKYTYCIRTYSRILHLPISVPLKDRHVAGSMSRSELLDSDWATGAAIFCRHEIIRDVGWDGSYFLSVEDVDICIRAKKSGWRVVVVPSALAFHTGESTRTSTMSAYYALRNRLWFARKYHDRRVRVLLTAYFLLLLFRLVVADLLKGRRPFRARCATRGILDGWRLWPDSNDALSGEPLWSRGLEG